MSLRDVQYLVELKTVNSTILKNACVAIGTQLFDVNLLFTADGMSLAEQDTSRQVTIQMLMDKFESYQCHQPTKICVDIANLIKILKGVGAKDVLTIFIENPDYANGDLYRSAEHQQRMGIRVYNEDKGQTSTFYLPTKEIKDDESIGNPDVNYPYYISMPSSDLQAILSNLQSVNPTQEWVKLQYFKDELAFCSRGAGGEFETKRVPTLDADNSIKIKRGEGYEDQPEEIIEIFFRLKKFVEFTKATPLSKYVIIMLKNDYPMFVEYGLSDIGCLRFSLTPNPNPTGW
jgi:proliferating cell nuclear antigen PCNA